MAILNDRINSITSEIDELSQQIKALECRQKALKEVNENAETAFKTIKNIIQNFKEDEEIIFDLKHALGALFLCDEELDRIANSQGSEFNCSAIATPETKPEAVEVGTSEVETETEPKPEETQSEEPKLSASGSIILSENPSMFWDNGKTLRMFLSTKQDVIATSEKVKSEGITDHHEIHHCGGDYILILGNIDTQEKADKVLEIWLEDEAEDMAEQEDQLAGIDESLTYNNFDSSESAQKFGEEVLEKGLCSRFEINGNGDAVTFYDADEDAIDHLMETEPEKPKDNKNWLNDTAYIVDGSATVHIGFPTKKLRDEWAKCFEFTRPSCKLEKQEFSYITNCKRELAVTNYNIGVTTTGSQFLEKIKTWDFTMTPDENREREKAIALWMNLKSKSGIAADF